MLEQVGDARIAGVGVSVAAPAKGYAVVRVPQRRVPLGLVNADGPVLFKDRSEGSEVVNVERIVESRVNAAALAGTAVAGEDRETPLAVRGEAPDYLSSLGFLTFEAAGNPLRIRASAPEDRVDADRGLLRRL